MISSSSQNRRRRRGARKARNSARADAHFDDACVVSLLFVQQKSDEEKREILSKIALFVFETLNMTLNNFSARFFLLRLVVRHSECANENHDDHGSDANSFVSTLVSSLFLFFFAFYQEEAFECYSYRFFFFVCFPSSRSFLERRREASSSRRCVRWSVFNERRGDRGRQQQQRRRQQHVFVDKRGRTVGRVRIRVRKSRL